MTPVYFIYHIERAAGTSLRNILRLHYGWGSKRVYAHYNVYEGKPGLNPFVLNEDTDAAQFFIGHSVFYGMHDVIRKPYHYVVILRDPLTRMLSWYNHSRTESVKAGRPLPEFWDWLNGAKSGTQVCALLRPNPPNLQEAMGILAKTSYIMLQETFDADVNQLFYPTVYHEYLNTTEQRSAKFNLAPVQFTEEERRGVEEIIKEDNILYDYAKKLREDGRNVGFKFPDNVVV